jgi:hypothetical protein
LHFERYFLVYLAEKHTLPLRKPLGLGSLRKRELRRKEERQREKVKQVVGQNRREKQVHLSKRQREEVQRKNSLG